MEQREPEMLQMIVVGTKAEYTDGIKRVSMKLTGKAAEDLDFTYLVEVPMEFGQEYEHYINGFFLGQKAEDTLLHDFQRATGVHIRKVLIKRKDDTSSAPVVASLYLLSEMGEVLTFSSPIHSSILYATLYDIPIFVERSLTREEVVESPSTLEETNENPLEAQIQSYFSTIQSGAKPEEMATPAEISSQLEHFSQPSLRQLLSESVRVENYEWAHLIQTFLDEKYGEAEQ